MTRAILCRAIGTHDTDSRGICRDCGKPLGASDPVAATCRLDELPGSRHQRGPAPVGFVRRWSV